MTNRKSTAPFGLPVRRNETPSAKSPLSIWLAPPTKSDLKTIVSKNTQDNRFNAFKNKVAQDIRGFLEKSVYEGWREVIPGKHPETAFFAYFSRELGGKAYLCVRKIKSTGVFKPYAIIDQKTFDAEIQNLRK